jgi:hypothetical protein
MILTPSGRGPVRARNPAWPFLLQAGAEEVGEQVVVAPPAAHFVQRHHEEVCSPRPPPASLAIGAAGDRIAQVPRQPVQYRRLEQECALPIRLAVEDLLER